MSKIKDKNKSKKNNLKAFLMMLVFAVGGGIVGYFGGKMAFISIPDSPKMYYWVWIPIFILVYFITIGIHELGHVLGGLWVRFKFKMYVVGPFMWKKEDNKLVFLWNKNLNIGGGLALCLPTDDHNLVKRFITFIAGGPAASLLLALATLLPYGLLNMHQAQVNFWGFSGSSFMIFLGLFSSIIFLATIIPMHSGGFFTDGARILNLLGGGNKAKLEVILLQTIAQASAGVRPREIGVHKLEDALKLETNSPFKIYVKGYLYQIYLDLGNVEQAEKYLNAYFEELHKIPGGYQASVILDKAFFEAAYKNNPEEAEELFKSAQIGAVIPKHHIYKTQAAIAFTKNNLSEARSWIEKSLKELSKTMDRGLAVVEKEWLDNTLQIIQDKFSQNTQDAEGKS
ncbi:MAG: hypothetical protein NW226_23220 [Microscillaceae bacterium]|nr:hypothetical protein [Microscillaceae bacterium]